MRRLRIRLEPLEERSWTERFVVVSLVTLVFTGTQLAWFGLAPGSSSHIVSQACALALVGWAAIRISPVGMAIGMGATYLLVFLDQATAGIGIAPLRFTPPTEYWTSNLAHVIITWAAFPLGAWLLARVLPEHLRGTAVGLALLPVPFIRFGPSDDVIAALLAPGSGKFVLIAVPWPLLALLAAAVSTALFLAGRWPRPRLTALALVALLTAVVPWAEARVNEASAANGLAVDPASGGPLTAVAVRAAFDDDQAGVPMFYWNGERIVRERSLLSVRTGMTSQASLSFIPATVGAVTAGPHEVAVELHGERRTGSFTISPAGHVSIQLDADRRVIVRGTPRNVLDLYVEGPDGPELLSTSLDGSGTWTSELTLAAGDYRIIAQSGDGWSELVTRSD